MLQQAQKRIAPHEQQVAFGSSGCIGTALSTVKKRHFSKNITVPQGCQHHLTTVKGGVANDHPALQHCHHAVAGIAFGKDLRPLRIVSDLSVGQDRFGFAVIEVPE